MLRKFKLRGMKTPFHPHGIALWRDPAGQDVRLFVVNHRTMHDHSIDIFRVDFEQNALTLVQSVVDPDYIHAPNDVWPTGPSSYVYPRLKRGTPPGLTLQSSLSRFASAPGSTSRTTTAARPTTGSGL